MPTAARRSPSSVTLRSYRLALVSTSPSSSTSSNRRRCRCPQGVRIWAPPLFVLLSVDGSNRLVPSQAARNAKTAGLDLITWTVERSGILADGNNGFYFQTYDAAIRREGDVFQVLDVLAKDVGIIGIFSDWPATVSFYANCMGLK